MDRNLLQEEDTQKGKYLTFSLGDESYGLEIAFVKEIVGIQPVTPLPEMPLSIKGIINLYGRIIPVVDMRLKFHMATGEYTERTCIIVIDVKGIAAGLIVDCVSEVLRIDEENIVPAPDYRAGANNRYIKAIGKVGQEVKLLLDCDNLFIGDVLKEFSHY